MPHAGHHVVAWRLCNSVCTEQALHSQGHGDLGSAESGATAQPRVAGLYVCGHVCQHVDLQCRCTGPVLLTTAAHIEDPGDRGQHLEVSSYG